MAINSVTFDLSGTKRTYKLARKTQLPSGARAWTVSRRPSQEADGVLRTADWQVWGPDLCSYEDDSGYLGVDYGNDMDTRWDGACYLAPARNAVTLTTSPAGTPANVNCSAIITGPSSVRFLYLGRGTKYAKVTISTMALAAEGSTAITERITSMVKTRNAAGTEEISLGMLATAYQVVTAVAAAGGSDTLSANNETIINQIMFNPKQDSRIFGMTGQVLRGNVLTGSVGMDASAWNTVSTLAGETITPTSISVDGNLVVIGTSDGPYMLDSERGTFFPIMPHLDQHSNACKQMIEWPGKGVLIPLQTGLVIAHNGDVASIGVERFKQNTSPVQGIPVALAITAVNTVAMVIYNPVTANYWLLEGHPREAGEWHNCPFSWHVIGNLSTTAVEHMTWVGTGDAARTQPALVIGQTSNMTYTNYGRTNRHPDDTGYTYSLSGQLYLTELRREPNLVKDVIAAEFFTAGCAASRTIDVAVSGNGGAYSAYGTTTVTTNGQQRLLFQSGGVPQGHSAGYRIKPRLTFTSNAATASPRIEGKFTLQYNVRPTMIDVVEVALVLDEANNFTVEEQADTLLAMWGGLPLIVTEDANMDTAYYRVASVSVEEVQEQGGPDGGRGPVQIATIQLEKWPVTAGSE